MAAGQFPKSPMKVDPVIPSAVGSRWSLNWEGRNKPAEAKRIIDDAADYIGNYIQKKLPPEILKDVDVMGSIEDKLYNYVNQAYVNMFNRYTLTVEDEMIKKVRNFVDKEEVRSLARYTPKDIAELLDKVGGSEKFNTGELEKSVVNMYGHLQGHIQRGMNDLENDTNAILRQKTDVGAFVRGENAYSIVKCAFKDNPIRPKTVTDIKLSINILDSELISPIFHYQVAVDFLLKDSLSQHLSELIDHEIDELKGELFDSGRAELTNGEIMFEKIKQVDKFTDDNPGDPNSKRYTILAKKFIDRIEGLRAEIEQDDYEPLNLREQIKKIIDSENIRNRGFNTAVNTITSILDTSKLGYQVCDNKKNARDCFIREYEDQNESGLPDERYSIRLVYLDQSQIRELKRLYDARLAAFVREVDVVWDVVHRIYESRKKNFFGLRRRAVVDFEDLAEKVMPDKWSKDRKKKIFDDDELSWDKLHFRDPPDTYVEKNHRTYTVQIKNLGDRLKYLQEKVQNLYGFQNPINRVVMDERLGLLVEEFNKFIYEINPHHLQGGLILDVDITTTKRKQYMMKSMANVLNEFLSGISQGFADAAFATFRRRRSTIRQDLTESFSTEKENPETMYAAAYRNMHDSQSESIPPHTAEQNGPQGPADVKPSSFEDKLDEMGLSEL